jgi:hypothetical protein
MMGDVTPTPTQIRDELKCEDCAEVCGNRAIWLALDEDTTKRWVYCDDHAPNRDPGVMLIRLWLDLHTEDGGLNPERLEAAAKTIYDSGLPTASFTKTGRTVPFDESLSPHRFRAAARAAILAYLGEPR